MSKQKEDIISDTYLAIVGVLKENSVDGMTGIECAVSAVGRLLLTVAKFADCPDPIKFVSEILHGAADQIDQQSRKKDKSPTRTS